LVGWQLGIDVFGKGIQRAEVTKQLPERNFQIEFALQ
jgi:hypothetical protein